MESIILAKFPVESEAYQAFAGLKQAPATGTYILSQAVLVKKEGSDYKLGDNFDTGIETKNDTLKGGLIGSLVGILGGPIGMLIGMGFGTWAGSAVDATDAMRNASMLEALALGLADGTVAILALVQEKEADVMDELFTKFGAVITRYEASEIAAEIEEARLAEIDMAKQAREALRKEKSAEMKEKLLETKAKIAKDFEKIKDQYK